MKTIAITLRNSTRIPRLEQHLKDSGILEHQIFYGIDNNTFGLRTIIPYEIDFPGSGLIMHHKVLGCLLSHWSLWNSLDFQIRNGDTSDKWMIVEDDVILLDGWKNAVDNALRDVPEDWDILFVGSCCLEYGFKKIIRPGLLEAHPKCLHCYIVRSKAIKFLVETNSIAWGPIDIQLCFKSFPDMKIYAINPRVADQVNTDIGPSYDE